MSKTKHLLVILFCVIIALSIIIGGIVIWRNNIKSPRLTNDQLFEKIDQVSNSSDVNVDNINTIFGIQLTKDRSQTNEYFLDYIWKSSFLNNSVVKSIEFREPTKLATNNSINFEIRFNKTSNISFDDTINYYGKNYIVHPSPLGAVEGWSTYTYKKSWGDVSFRVDNSNTKYVTGYIINKAK